MWVGHEHCKQHRATTEGGAEDGLASVNPSARVLCRRCLLLTEDNLVRTIRVCIHWERNKHIKKKTRKQNFRGIIPGFWGGLCLCVFLPHKEWPEKTHKQNFGTHPVPGQSRKFICVYVFFLSLNSWHFHARLTKSGLARIIYWMLNTYSDCNRPKYASVSRTDVHTKWCLHVPAMPSRISEL